MENQNAPKPPKKPAPAPKSDMGIFSWMITIILSSIPLLNIILMFVWAFSSKKPSRKNWAIANIILVILLIGITVGICYALGYNVNDVYTLIQQSAQ